MIAAGALATLGLLYFWLPYRIAVVQLYIRLGGSRLTIPAEYKPLDSPTYVPVTGADQYPADAEVLSLELNGQARAIPCKRLAWHLVINDQIGNEPVAVTLCTVSDAAIAYRATCGGKILRFTPARLARNNLVLRDVQTGSSWQQFTGTATDGPLAGAELVRIPLARVRLADWRRRHPAGVILTPLGNDRDRTAPNDSCPVMSHFASRPFLLQSPTHEDARLARKQRVVGMAAAGDAVAWCGGPAADAGEEESGLQIACYWFAWSEFHPQSRLVDSPVFPGKTDVSEYRHHGLEARATKLSQSDALPERMGAPAGVDRPGKKGQSHVVPPVSSPAESGGVHTAPNTASEDTGGTFSAHPISLPGEGR
ncbi:MAG: DUF3179 domain-containing (seleno)protein [Tepidisphaerales bacterium]